MLLVSLAWYCWCLKRRELLKVFIINLLKGGVKCLKCLKSLWISSLFACQPEGGKIFVMKFKIQKYNTKTISKHIKKPERRGETTQKITKILFTSSLEMFFGIKVAHYVESWISMEFYFYVGEKFNLSRHFGTISNVRIWEE